MSAGLCNLDLKNSYLITMTMFANVGKSHLLVKNGGKYNFKHSWVMRFWTRHKMF